MRIPGKYINLKDHPLDTEEEVAICVETEEYLQSGLLPDASGKVTGDRPMYARKKGHVRNLLHYPLYHRGVKWPSVDGSTIQTRGKFTKQALDNDLVNVWEYWVLSGAWGPAFTHPNATPETRRLARETNKADLEAFLNPRKTDPFAWTEVHEWLSNNKGKKALLDEVMSSKAYEKKLAATFQQHLRDDFTLRGIVSAYPKAIEDMLWDLYIKDTKSTRTVWGYISKVRMLLIAETQQQVNVMLGLRKAKVWEQWLLTIQRTGVPLNANRYHRITFMGRLNQLVYANTIEKQRTVEKELVKVGGKIMENRLITTGSRSSVLKQTWAQSLENQSITALASGFDFPVFFGDLHCRIMVISQPRPTCFVIFRGTTNAWEWVVDLDFTEAEYGQIVEGQTPGTYSMKISHRLNSSLTDAVHGSKDKFSLHRGFLRAWKAFRPSVVAALKDIYNKYSIQDVIVTGHSLGAGITQIACLEIPSVPIRTETSDVTSFLDGFKKHTTTTYRRPHAYMYASPTVGDSRFVWHFVNQTSESAHIYIDGDLVTMIPPLLLPDKNVWGVASRDKYLEDMTTSDSGGSAMVSHLLTSVFGGEGIPIDPRLWNVENVLDWKRVARSAHTLNMAYMKHRAYRGGGLFIRLDDDLSGSFIEESSDPGSSDNTIQTLMTGIVDHKLLLKRHSIDSIVQALVRIQTQHPDIYQVIQDTQSATWEDAVSIPSREIQPVPSSVEKLIENGEIVAVGRTEKHYMPFQFVPVEEILPDSIVPIDGVKRPPRKRRKKRDDTYL